MNTKAPCNKHPQLRFSIWQKRFWIILKYKMYPNCTKCNINVHNINARNINARKTNEPPLETASSIKIAPFEVLFAIQINRLVSI